MNLALTRGGLHFAMYEFMHLPKPVPRTNLLKLAAICASLGFAYASSDARSPLCDWTIATTSIYFVPHVKDYCRTSTPCPKFRRQVRVQGSGTLPGNRVLTYTGKIKSLGSCDTAIGAAGVCLRPYISVAADPRYYNMGDIIQMPSMKGRVVALPNGKTFVHPGYFIVEDVGGAIKGPNRFDFFTGSAGLTNPLNSFGTKGGKDSQLQDPSDCGPRKSFGFMRRGTIGNKAALAAIDKAFESSNNSRSVASSARAGVH